jgi:hypothetical protein
LGEVGDKANTSNSTNGIYGLQNGELRYKLDEKGSFYVGTGEGNFISFNEVNDYSDSNELSIKVQNFTLNTNNLDIASKDSTIKISDGEKLRLLMGQIQNDTYGLDIYEGSLWIYGCP